MARFYADEQFPRAATDHLQLLGHDVLGKLLQHVFHFGIAFLVRSTSCATIQSLIIS
jgi:hypothetical protein